MPVATARRISADVNTLQVAVKTRFGRHLLEVTSRK